MQRINLKCRLKFGMNILRMFFQLPIFHSATARREKGAIASDLLQVNTTAPADRRGLSQAWTQSIAENGWDFGGRAGCKSRSFDPFESSSPGTWSNQTSWLWDRWWPRKIMIGPLFENMRMSHNHQFKCGLQFLVDSVYPCKDPFLEAWRKYEVMQSLQQTCLHPLSTISWPSRFWFKRVLVSMVNLSYI